MPISASAAAMLLARLGSSRAVKSASISLGSARMLKLISCAARRPVPASSLCWISAGSIPRLFARASSACRGVMSPLIARLLDTAAVAKIGGPRLGQLAPARVKVKVE